MKNEEKNWFKQKCAMINDQVFETKTFVKNFESGKAVGGAQLYFNYVSQGY